MILTFTITAVGEVIARGTADAQANGGFRDPHFGLSAADNRKPGLWLVGDHGVYLCSNGELAEGASPSSPTPRNATPTDTTIGSRSNAGRSAAMTAWISSTPMALRP